MLLQRRKLCSSCKGLSTNTIYQEAMIATRLSCDDYIFVSNEVICELPWHYSVITKRENNFPFAKGYLHTQFIMKHCLRLGYVVTIIYSQAMRAYASYLEEPVCAQDCSRVVRSGHSSGDQLVLVPPWKWKELFSRHCIMHLRMKQDIFPPEFAQFNCTCTAFWFNEKCCVP